MAYPPEREIALSQLFSVAQYSLKSAPIYLLVGNRTVTDPPKVAQCWFESSRGDYCNST